MFPYCFFHVSVPAHASSRGYALGSSTSLTNGFDSNWKQSILLPNKTVKQYTLIENDISKIKVPQFLYCDYVCMFVSCAITTAYTVWASRLNFEPWSLHMISKCIFYFFEICISFWVIPLFLFSQFSLYQGYECTD